MIIVKFTGGLGNQMFQYAAGLALSMLNKTELRSDLSWFKYDRAHNGFELSDVFRINIEEATFADISNILGLCKYNRLRNLLQNNNLSWFRPLRYGFEPHFNYWEEFTRLPKAVYLEGYWQSDRYFHDYADTVRNRFQFDMPVDSSNIQAMRTITSCESVSIHVRRGDYFSNSVNQSVHGVCLKSYYKRAMSMIIRNIPSAKFFIFSDDPDWAENHFSDAQHFFIIRHNAGNKSYRDMQLMSLCRHHITANSSFSWWGAWLGEYANGWIISPKEWFLDESINISDLHCSKWIKL
jgi:hypothetical protein